MFSDLTGKVRLKNKCKIADQPEDPEKYQQYRRKKEIQIERLEVQLKARLPKGRNVTNGEMIACRDTKQLLSNPIQQKPKKGKKAKKHTHYELLLRRRQQQQDNDIKRQQAQTKFANNRFGESELGIYVDRLLAKAIVEMAIQYQASSIILPDLKNVREILDSEIQAKAETKIPGCKKAQKQYAGNYRKNIHRWSYARLCDAIKSKAIQKGLAIETSRQIPSGTPEIQARDLALIAYHHRQQATS